MKILWVSNAPWVGTGYGQQTSLVTPRLNKVYPTAIAANFGLHGAKTTWNEMPVYPAGYDVWSNDVIPSHANDWLGGEPGDGWTITLMDVWVFRNPRFQRMNVACWTPVDHLPVPPEVASWFRDSGAVPIAMSEFGRAQLNKAGVDCLYVPHGIDTDVFSPGDRAEAREILQLPKDAFIVTMNAANKGKAIVRKSFAEAFLGFARFAHEHSDAVLYMHTEHLGLGDGINLVGLAEACGIPEEQLFWVDQYAYRLGLNDRLMAATYRAADVLLAPSMGEGFGIPVIEAEACGIPVIASDFTAQPELVAGGWLVGGEPYWDASQHAWLQKPYVRDIYDALEDAYNGGGDGVAARDAALEYDMNYVWDEYWIPVLKNLEDRLPTVAPLKSGSIDIKNLRLP